MSVAGGAVQAPASRSGAGRVYEVVGERASSDPPPRPRPRWFLWLGFGGLAGAWRGQGLNPLSYVV